MKRFLCTLWLCVLAVPASAQTLSPGDIAIIGMNADNPDAFAFVALVNIPSGTQIKFTDNGWRSSGVFRGNEQTVVFTAPAMISAGTVLAFGAGSPAFSTEGDQLLAYQGSDANPSFLHALNNEGNGVWQADATSSNTSALPSGLANGATAVAVNEMDNVKYNGTTTGTRSQLLAAISNKINWTGSNSTRQTFPAAFTVTGTGGGNVAPQFTSVLTSREIPPEVAFSFTYEATDQDDDPLTFSLANPPAGAAIGAATGVFTWTPSANQAGESYSISANVTDGTATAQTNALLTVRAPAMNQPPAFTAAMPDTIIDSGMAIAFSYAAADPENDPLTFSLVDPPPGAMIDEATGAFSWTTSEAGVFAVTATVTDGAAAASARSLVGVRGTLFPGESEAMLRQSLRSAFAPVPTTLGYSDARDTMYAKIDFDADGFVRGVYTGFAAELTPGDPSTVLFSQGINAEHTWPQSKGAGDEPARSDIHNLFPAKDNVNSARSNKPFAEIPDDQTQAWYRLDQSQSNTPTANIDEYSESMDGAFEPREMHKGNAARAALYFFVIYESVADRTFLAEASQLDHLIAWNMLDPADLSEVVRTWKIAQYQGRINPFVVDASLALRAFSDIVATEAVAEAPGGFTLAPAYPNPFNPRTTLRLTVDRPQRVRVVVHDVLGRPVRVLHEGLILGPAQPLTFDATALPSGVYYVRVVGETAIRVQAVTLLK